MTSRLFAPSVLALAAALGTLMFANVVTQGFASEGCRFAAEDGERWARAGEYFLVQGLLFGVPTAIVVLLLYRVMTARLTEHGSTSFAPRAMVWCFGGAFAAMTLAGAHFLVTCGGRTGLLGAIAPAFIALRFLAPVLALVGFIALLAGLFQGLGSIRKT